MVGSSFLTSVTLWVSSLRLASCLSTGAQKIGPIIDGNNVYLEVTRYITNFYYGVEIADDDFGGFTWEEANEFCGSVFGTQLGSARDSNSNNDMYNAINKVATINDWAWIGVVDISSSNSFTFADGLDADSDSTQSYSNWADGYPLSSARGQNCGEMRPGDGGNKWYTWDCDEESAKAFVCDRFNIYQNNEYIGVSVAGEESFAFSDVDDYCNSKFGNGATAASIDSSNDNTIVQGILTELNSLQTNQNVFSSWIGFKLTVDSASAGTCSFSFDDGTSTNWAVSNMWDDCKISYMSSDGDTKRFMISRYNGEWDAYASYWGTYSIVCNCDSNCQDDNSIYTTSVTQRTSIKSSISARQSTSSNSSKNNGSNDDNTMVIIIVACVLSVLLLIGIGIGYKYYYRKNKVMKQGDEEMNVYQPPAAIVEVDINDDDDEEHDVKVY